MAELPMTVPGRMAPRTTMHEGSNDQTGEQIGEQAITEILKLQLNQQLRNTFSFPSPLQQTS